jgi:hypothetical protein
MKRAYLLRSKYIALYVPVGLAQRTAIVSPALHATCAFVLNAWRFKACKLLPVIPEIEIWRAANLMLKRYGEKAVEESATRADELAAQDDYNGEAVWRRIRRPACEPDTVRAAPLTTYSRCATDPGGRFCLPARPPRRSPTSLGRRRPRSKRDFELVGR